MNAFRTMLQVAGISFGAAIVSLAGHAQGPPDASADAVVPVATSITVFLNEKIQLGGQKVKVNLAVAVQGSKASTQQKMIGSSARDRSRSVDRLKRVAMALIWISGWMRWQS